jgi:hypothetical protein
MKGLDKKSERRRRLQIPAQGWFPRLKFANSV